MPRDLPAIRLGMAIFLALLPPAAIAQAPRCVPADIFQHVGVLAADSMAGRAPGSRGDQATQRYLAQTLARLGLRPGGTDGYLQRVPLHRGRVSGGSLALVAASGAVPLRGVLDSPRRDTLVTLDAEAVWVGYGIDAPDLGWSDYTGAPLHGKMVVLLEGLPAGLQPRIPYGGTPFFSTREHKVASALRHGAAAVLVLADSGASVTPASPAWRYYSDAGTHAVNLTAVADSVAFFRALVAKGFSLTALDRTGATPTRPLLLSMRVTASLHQEVEDASSANVIGMIPGTTARWIAISAHHDGLGIGRPDATGDSIYNGAQDDALGVAMALCTAGRLARARPEAGIVVILTAAEERGAVGSRYWVTHPTLDLHRLRFALDLDALGIAGPTEDFLAYGSSALTSVALLQAAGAAAGFTLAQTEFQKNMYFAFDAASFAGAGVPAVTIGQGTRLAGMSPQQSFQKLRPVMMRYHSTADAVQSDWDTIAVARYAGLVNTLIDTLLATTALPQLQPAGPYHPLAGLLAVDPADSAYLLPYRVGTRHRLLQGNWFPAWGHTRHAAYAFDFDAPLGTPVTAARGGVVVKLVSEYRDGNRTPGKENVIVIQHADSTFGRYYHLARNGVMVRLGEVIRRGQVIGRSGNTGASAGPHIHFDVTRSCFDWGCPTVPIRFLNAGADLLVRGETYAAGRPPAGLPR